MDVRPAFLLSPHGENGYRIAIINQTPTDPLTLQVDGETSPAHGTVYDLLFSADAKHFAYVATDRWDWRGQGSPSAKSLHGEWRVYLDGKPGPVLPAVALGSLRFSPDGTKLAYVLQKGPNEFVAVLDGREEASVERINLDSLKFSQNGKHFGYLGRQGKLWYPVIDGKKTGKGHENPWNFYFSPDGERVAFKTSNELRQSIEVDGVPYPSFAEINSAAFTADSKHFAYLGHARSRMTPVWDGKAGPEADEILSPGLIVSPDGKRIAYVRRAGQNWQVVENGKSGPYYSGIGTAASGEKNPRSRGPALVFSADSQHMAYAARKGTRSFVVLDDKPQAEYVGVGDPVFSPDGRLAYIAHEKASSRVVLDGKPGAPFNLYSIRNLAFSPDGKHLAYSVNHGYGDMSVSVDGEMGLPFGTILVGPAWRADGSVEYVAYKQFEDVIKIFRIVTPRPGAKTDAPAGP